MKQLIRNILITPEWHFGDFQAKLADIPEHWEMTIPDFHNMEFRLKQLRDAVAANAARQD